MKSKMETLLYMHKSVFLLNPQKPYPLCTRRGNTLKKQLEKRSSSEQKKNLGKKEKVFQRKSYI